MVIAGVSWVFCGLAGSGVFDCVTYRSLSYQPTIFLRVCVCVCGSMMMTASEWSTSYSYFQLLQYWTASIDPANDELLIINAIPYTICYVLRAMMLLSHSGKIEAKLQERKIITMKTRSRREREKKKRNQNCVLANILLYFPIFSLSVAMCMSNQSDLCCRSSSPLLFIASSSAHCTSANVFGNWRAGGQTSTLSYCDSRQRSPLAQNNTANQQQQYIIYTHR